MFKSPLAERKNSAAREFDRLVELKNFEIRASVIEDSKNLKTPLLGEKDEVGKAQQRLNVIALHLKINPLE